MADQRTPLTPDPKICTSTSQISRRHLIAGSAATVASTSLVRPVLGQQATPGASASTAASPDTNTVDLEAFRTLCQTVVGVESLPDEPLKQLLELIRNDEKTAAGLQELLTADPEAAVTGGRYDPAGLAVTNIVEFSYLGNFYGKPVENRAELFSSLISYQTLPYVTTPAVCKNFGYWAEEIDLPERP